VLFRQPAAKKWFEKANGIFVEHKWSAAAKTWLCRPQQSYLEGHSAVLP
jgi:hypothetical protein